MSKNTRSGSVHEMFAEGMGLTDTALAVADGHRREVSPGLDEDGRKRLGQFMTPSITARLMAEHFHDLPKQVRLLDAGAGMGALTAAFVGAACVHAERPPVHRRDVL